MLFWGTLLRGDFFTVYRLSCPDAFSIFFNCTFLLCGVKTRLSALGVPPNWIKNKGVGVVATPPGVLPRDSH